MPYALGNLRDGQAPSARYVKDASRAVAGEVVVADADYLADRVWDARASRLRPKTDAERLAEDQSETARRESFGSAVATLRASVNPDVRALVVVLERAGAL